MDAFKEAAKLRPKAAKYWLDQLAMIDSNSYDEIFANLPDGLISDAATEFALKILQINTNRLLKENS